MTNRQILRNECEQAMLQLENAFLKFMETSRRKFTVSHIAGHLCLDELLPRIDGINGAALGRAIAKRLEEKNIVEINTSTWGPWRIRLR